MNENSFVAALKKFRVIPVIAIDSIEDALPLADALMEGGLPVAEITFRTAAAAGAIETISKHRPEMLIGAGTVLTADNLKAAKNAGAKFAVAPGLNAAIVEKAIEAGLPFIPGVATPSEIETALSLGCKILKFFPAGELGGVKMLKALSAPYAHTGVKFVPTGGIGAENMADYLALDTVLCVGGTWIATKEDIKNGNWSAIKSRAAAVRKNG